MSHSVVANSVVKRIRGALLLEEKSPGILATLKVLPADIKAVNATASLFIKSLLLGIDHSLQKKQNSVKFDDSIDIEDIEELPFEEALEYMQKRLPISAEEYYKLSDKARFRAFTVARLTDGDSLKKAKKLLENSIAEGGTLTEFLKKTDTELLGDLGLAGKGGGWYWENVYRTNVQTAYNTGRAIGFENVKPLALELVGIGDSRQTELCRSLTQPPVRQPYGDEFWKRYWPPLHFSCRTTVRAIYDPAELEEEPLTNIPDGIEDHRAKGFGTYPIDSDSWWDELPSMKRRAVAYGVQGEIARVKGKLFNSAIKESKKIGTIIKNIPMTFEEADGGKVNPFYSLGENFTKNCQACIAAFEARLKGFSVRAKPFDDNNIYFKRLSLNPAKAFIDPYTKHHPVWMESPIFINAEDCISYIKKIVKRNQRYVMSFIWEYNKTGHVISIIRTNKGKLFFYDPQDSSIYERKDFLDLFKSIYFEEKYKQPQFFRTDYLQFDENMLKSVLEASDE